MATEGGQGNTNGLKDENAFVYSIKRLFSVNFTAMIFEMKIMTSSLSFPIANDSSKLGELLWKILNNSSGEGVKQG